MINTSFKDEPKPNPVISLCAFHVATGQKGFMQTTEISISEKIADIVFHALDEIPNCMKDHVNNVQIDPKVDPKVGERVSITTVLSNMDSCEDIRKNVKRVLINFYSPIQTPVPRGEAKLPHNIWTTLIPVIGSICKKLFPNLKPEESNFNVHFGFNHYRADSQLQYDATVVSLYLGPK